ncbi:MAG: hypothetical protein AAGE52_13085 [Myxococcota bacterium]
MRTITLGALALATALVGTAHADVPEGLMYSDFDAYFILESESSGREDEGWYLKFNARLYGDGIPSDSGLRYVVKQGRRTLATVECNGDLRQRPRYNFEEGVPGYMDVGRCKDDDQLTKAVGDITIEVYFINGDDDSTALVRTHNIVVRRFDKVRRAPEYYLVLNGEVATAMLHEYIGSERNPTSAPRTNVNYVGLYTWVAESESNGVQPDGDDWARDINVRCSVNGERLPTDARANTRTIRDRGTRVMASWGEGRQNERNQYDFQLFHVRLPITFGSDTGRHLPGAANMDEHPGQWECQIRHGRQVHRTVRFVVADGRIQPHPEQTAGGVFLAPRTNLATITVTENSHETRVSPDHAARGPFFGVGWTSDEGRAMAEGLPAIGEADLPGEPRARRRRRRGRRGR